jgi:predicted ATPase
MKKLICFTGAPCSGKTASMKLLGHMKGYKKLYIVDEAPSYLTDKGNGLHTFPQTDEENDVFDRLVYTSRVYSTMEARRREEDIVFFDRGTLDGYAYVDDFCEKMETDIETELKRYDAVILLQTLAFTGDYELNDTRWETPERAIEIHKKLEQVYSMHKNFLMVPANMDTIRRVASILEFIDNIR